MIPGVGKGVSQGDQSDYFLPNIMISKILSDSGPIPAVHFHIKCVIIRKVVL